MPVDIVYVDESVEVTELECVVSWVGSVLDVEPRSGTSRKQ